jgi:hypothetical protein
MSLVDLSMRVNGATRHAGNPIVLNRLVDQTEILTANVVLHKITEVGRIEVHPSLIEMAGTGTVKAVDHLIGHEIRLIMPLLTDLEVNFRDLGSIMVRLLLLSIRASLEQRLNLGIDRRKPGMVECRMADCQRFSRGMDRIQIESHLGRRLSGDRHSQPNHLVGLR